LTRFNINLIHANQRKIRGNFNIELRMLSYVNISLHMLTHIALRGREAPNDVSKVF
jgi:hypothetical protein